MKKKLQILVPQYKEDEKKYAEIEVPDISGRTGEDAKRILAEAGFEIKIKGSGGIICDQIPKAHTKLSAGSAVVAYMDGTNAERTAVVPNVIGMNASEAAAEITNEGLNARIKGVSGTGYAICSAQSPQPGTIVEPGTVVTVDFKYTEAVAD